MNVMTITLFGVVFLFAATFVTSLYLIWSDSGLKKKRLIKKRLLYISAGGKHGYEKLNRFKDTILKDAGLLEKLAFKLPRISSLDRLLIKSQTRITTSLFLTGSLLLSIAGTTLCYFLFLKPLTAVGLGILILALPFLLLKLKEKAYLAKFEEQLPEALDFLGRALRSGHAFMSGLEMLAEEAAEPIKSEFKEVVDEIRLGLSVREAMDNLCERVPIADLNFFAIAVSIQKETGGNLTEILDKISTLIRERVKFKRQVRSMTADGRISGIILMVLPIALFTYIYLVNYEYISLLWTEKMGWYMLIAAVIFMICGGIAINKIANVEI